MSTPSAPPREDFGILLGLAYQHFVDALNAHLLQHGFTDLGSSYGYVLRAVAAERLTATQLASQLQLTPQGAAKIVDEMVKRGYLERRVDQADARARLLFLAPRGERALRAARAFHRAFERSFARRHGAEQARRVRDGLEALLRVGATASPSTSATRRLRPL